MKIAIASWLMDFDGAAVHRNRQGGISGEAYVLKQLYEEFSARGHEVLLLQKGELNRAYLRGRGIDFLLGCTCWQPLPVCDDYVTGYYHVNYWLRYLTLALRFTHPLFHVSQLAGLLTVTRADVYFTNSPLIHEALCERCRLSYLAPLFADVEYFRPVAPRAEYACDACYLGANFLHKTARQVQEYLVAASRVCDFRIYGKGWDRHPVLKKYWGGILPAENVPALYSSASIVINFNASLQAKTGMMNNRFFEALACGAYVVNDPIPWAQETFGGLVSFTPGGEHLQQLLPALLADRAVLRAKALQAREIIRTRFTPKHAVDQFLEGYARAREWLRRRPLDAGEESLPERRTYT